MKVHILDGTAPAGEPRTLCQKRPYQLWPDKCYPITRNIKTIINQLKKSGRQAELCIFCTKWADIAWINEVEV